MALPPSRARAVADPVGTTLAVWVGIAVLGMIVFVLGAWEPYWRSVAYGTDLSYGTIVLGAVLVVLGLTMANRAREHGRRIRADKAAFLHQPGIELYTPPRLARDADKDDDA